MPSERKAVKQTNSAFSTVSAAQAQNGAAIKNGSLCTFCDTPDNGSLDTTIIPLTGNCHGYRHCARHFEHCQTCRSKSDSCSRCFEKLSECIKNAIALLLLLVLTALVMVVFLMYVRLRELGAVSTQNNPSQIRQEPVYQGQPNQEPNTPTVPPLETLKTMSTSVTPSPVSTTTEQPLCLTPRCIKLADHILSRMNASAHPCNDFYEFACGRWLHETPIPENQILWNDFWSAREKTHRVMRTEIESPPAYAWGSAEKKAKTLYDSCMDRNEMIDKLGNAPLLEMIDKMDGWDLLESLDTTNWTLERSLLQAANYGFTPFMWIVTSHDDKNTSRYVIGINPGQLTLGNKMYYVNRMTGKPYPMNDTASMPYHIVKMMTNIGVLFGVEYDIAEAKMSKVLEFEMELAMIYQENVEPKQNYHLTTMSELQKTASFLNWSKFLKLSFDGIATLADDEAVVVYGMPWLKNLTTLMEKYLASDDGIRVLDNYVKWYVVHMMLPYMAKPFQEPKASFYKTYLGQNAEYPRWLECILRAEQPLSLAFSAIYVRSSFSLKAKEKALRMVTQVNRAFKHSILSLQWMDESTRSAALEKLKTAIYLVGFGEDILDPKILDAEYEDLTINEDNYFGNMLRAYAFYRRRNLNRLRSKPNRHEWEYPVVPTNANAYYDSKFNRIAIPAGILKEPFFSINYPMWMNFAGIGIVLGHELSHGFDNTGREHDSNGNLFVWWSNESTAHFEEKANCFVEQYSNYSCLGYNLDGQRTLSENIADNVALKLAFKAYEDWKKHYGSDFVRLPGVNLSESQLFFLSFAQAWCGKAVPRWRVFQILSDAHTIEKYRVIGSLSNYPRFSEDYRCPLGSPMNPTKKCEIW